MSRTPRLEESLARWESAPSPERAVELLDAAEAALASDGVAPALWHRWLDTTRRREHLLALPGPRGAPPLGRRRRRGRRRLRLRPRGDARPAGRRRTPAGRSSPPAPLRTRRAGATRTSRGAPTPIAAALLGARGRSPRVAIVSENGFDSACVDLACLLHGLLVSPLSPHLTPGELTAAFDALGVNLAVVSSEESLRRLRETARRVARPFRVVLLDEAAELAGEGDVVLGEALAALADAAVPARSRAPRGAPSARRCTVLFTSGSTGGQKGVAFSMENLVTKRFARAAALPFVGEEEVLLCFLPLYHTFGRYLEMLGMLFWGGTYVFAGNPSLDGLAAGLEEVEPTGLVSIPIRWAQLEARARAGGGRGAVGRRPRRPALRTVVGGRLRWGLSAAGYLAPQVFRFFQAHGVELCSGFGMTEATGGITMTPPGEYEEGSVGLPLPGIRVRLGESDELEIAGPYVARYLDEPEAARGRGALGEDGGRLPASARAGTSRSSTASRTSTRTAAGGRSPRAAWSSASKGCRESAGSSSRATGGTTTSSSSSPTPTTPSSAGDPQGEAARDYLRRIVAAANRDLATYERVVDFAVLPRDFSLEAGELTPKGSYRRKAIEKAFAGRPRRALPQPRRDRSRATGVTVDVPRWLFRDLGLLEGDLVLEGGRLVDRRRGRSATLAARPGGEEVRVGSLAYRCAGREGRPRALRPPAASLARERRARRPPPREGRLGDAPRRLLRGGPPPAARRGRPKGTPGAPPEPLPSPQLAALHRLSVTALFGPPDAALEAVSRAEALLRQGDRRTAELLRRRLQALARHPDARVRCEAYRVLLLDDPLVDTGTILPAFLHSGLPFLSEESVAAIARADLGEERLTALRRRLHSYRAAMTGPLPAVTRQTLGDVLELLAGFARHHPEDHAAVRAELASWAIQAADPALARRADALFDALGEWHEETAAARRSCRPSRRAGRSSATATDSRRRRSARSRGSSSARRSSASRSSSRSRPSRPISPTSPTRGSG